MSGKKVLSEMAGRRLGLVKLTQAELTAASGGFCGSEGDPDDVTREDERVPFIAVSDRTQAAVWAVRKGLV